jgi:hypothetical protein
MSASVAQAEAADALRRLAAELRADEVIAPHVRDTSEHPALGTLAAAGPHAAQATADYVLLFEAIREGYLLHYDSPRLLEGADPDLRLLAGDYLYALGLRRLAARGDMEAVRELSDLISLSAQLHAREERGLKRAALLNALWLACASAVGRGASERHELAKKAVREGGSEAESLLIEGALEGASPPLRRALARAADSIGFVSEHPPDSG